MVTGQSVHGLSLGHSCILIAVGLLEAKTLGMNLAYHLVQLGVASWFLGCFFFPLQLLQANQKWKVPFDYIWQPPTMAVACRQGFTGLLNSSLRTKIPIMIVVPRKIPV